MNLFSILSRVRPKRAKAIVGLDVGTRSIKIAVGECRSGGRTTLFGAHLDDSNGLRNGELVNAVAARHALTRAIREAEEALGIAIREVVLSVAGDGRETPLARLIESLRAHPDIPLVVARTVPRGLASAIAVLDSQDKAGVVVLDLGAGTSDYVVYAGNKVCESGVIPVGGEQLADRMDELLRSIHCRIAAQGTVDLAGGVVLLTGGCSRLRGLPELASSIFGTEARRAVPQGFDGLTDHLAVPEMATVVGLIKCGHTKSPT